MKFFSDDGVSDIATDGDVTPGDVMQLIACRISIGTLLFSPVIGRANNVG